MMAIHRIRKARQRSKGGAAVEFALILPLLLVLVFGVIEFSLALYNKMVITNASREAARAGIVLRTPRLTKDQITKVATDYCGNNLITFGKSNVPKVNVDNSAGTNFGNPLTVTVDVNYAGMGLGNALSVFTGGMTLSAVTRMNYE
jgi:Flp pilus assembly protein TadG